VALATAKSTKRRAVQFISTWGKNDSVPKSPNPQIPNPDQPYNKNKQHANETTKNTHKDAQFHTVL
jgi:hypothetical protein